MCLVRIFGIPGGLGNPLGTDGGGARRVVTTSAVPRVLPTWAMSAPSGQFRACAG